MAYTTRACIREIDAQRASSFPLYVFATGIEAHNIRVWLDKSTQGTCLAFVEHNY